MITFSKLFEVALESRKSTYFCLQIELDCSSSNCISNTCNSIQSNIVKYNTFFKISKRICLSGYFTHFVVFSNYLNCTKCIENYCSKVASIVSKNKTI